MALIIPKLSHERGFIIETVLEYKPFDGGKGYIVKIRPKPKNSKVNEEKKTTIILLKN